MKKNFTFVLVFAVTISLMSFDILTDNGRAGVTGSPSEKTCNQAACHDSYAVNAPGGSVKIAAPTLTNWSYVPGQTYAISVTISKTGAKLFGLGFEALTSANANAGTLTAGTGTKTLSTPIGGVSRMSITHTGTGNTGTDSHVFTFNWKAPATDIGKITFYCAANAANGTGSEAGDYIYTTSQVVGSPSTAGIAEQMEFSKEINIFPNPATDHLQIVNTTHPSDIMTVSIIDMKGSLISQKQHVASNESFALDNNMKAGAYSLRIETSGKMATKQFIKQ